MNFCIKRASFTYMALHHMTHACTSGLHSSPNGWLLWYIEAVSYSWGTWSTAGESCIPVKVYKFVNASVFERSDTESTGQRTDEIAAGHMNVRCDRITERLVSCDLLRQLRHHNDMKPNDVPPGNYWITSEYKEPKLSRRLVCMLHNLLSDYI